MKTLVEKCRSGLLDACARIIPKEKLSSSLEARGLLGRVARRSYANNGRNEMYLVQAAREGNASEVARLIKLCDPKECGSMALMNAAMFAPLEVVEMLIPVSEPKANYGMALQSAVVRGDREIFEALLAVSDPRLADSAALAQAAESGCVEIFGRLLPMSDPFANESWALRRACEYGNPEIVEMLWPCYAGREEEFFEVVENSGGDASPYMAIMERKDLVDSVVAGKSCDPVEKKRL